MWGMCYLKKWCLSNPSLLLLQQQSELSSVPVCVAAAWGAALCTSLSSAWLCFPASGELWGDASLSLTLGWDSSGALLAHAKLHKMMSRIFLPMLHCFSQQQLCDCMLIVVLCWGAGVAFATKAILVQLLHFFDSENEDFIFIAICFSACFRADGVVCLYLIIFVI